MGSRTDIAERNVAEQRQRLSRMVSDLEDRATEDVQAATSRVGERASELQHRAGNALDSMPGKSMFDEQVPKHPLTSILGGLGVGMVIGMLSSGSSSSNGSGRQQQRPDRSNQSRNGGESDGGMFSALSSAAVTRIAEPIQEELKGIAQQAVDGFLGKGSGGHSGASTQAQHSDGKAPREEHKNPDAEAMP